MAETPDFDAMADEMLGRFANAPLAPHDRATILEYLRQVWNARGAADLAAMNSDSIDPNRAIRQLDC